MSGILSKRVVPGSMNYHVKNSHTLTKFAWSSHDRTKYTEALLLSNTIADT